HADELGPMLETVTHQANEIGMSPVPVPMWLPTEKMAVFRHALRTLDTIVSLVLAGHETTANALSWAFLLLARHPEIADRVADEARTVLGDRAPTLADVPKLGLAKRVIEESLRLYP